MKHVVHIENSKSCLAKIKGGLIEGTLFSLTPDIDLTRAVASRSMYESGADWDT